MNAVAQNLAILLVYVAEVVSGREVRLEFGYRDFPTSNNFRKYLDLQI